MSDHAVISVSLNIQVDHCSSNANCGYHVNRPIWDKATEDNINLYKSALDDMLTNIHIPWDLLHCKDLQFNRSSHILSINEFTESVLSACVEACQSSIPHSCPDSGDKKSKEIPGWKQHVEPARQTALFWHFLWKENGSPSHGHIASIRRRTRSLYHLAIRKVNRDKAIHIATHMTNTFRGKDDKSFWKSVKKVNKSNASLPSTVDNVQGTENISNLFAEKYNDLYNSVSYNSEDMSSILSDLESQITTKCNVRSCSFKHCVDVSMVQEAIKELKPNKHDGNHFSYSNHFINGTEKLNALLSLLITSMLCHGHAPHHILLSTIVPIIKDKRKSCHDSNNYRGIALSSILGKIIDNIIIKSQLNVLSTSDMQFGFKEKCSTTQCTFVVSEVINYYVSNKSNVYCILLDASKAFDRVNFVKLFQVLIAKNMCPTIARFLALLYTCQQCRCKWENSISDAFNVTNGVKQGGVLSPLLFNIYLDVLLCNLRLSGYGCHVGNTFMGSLAYADDVILLCPTVYAMKKLLSICEEFSADYDILFNATKSKLLIFGDNCQNVNIQFQGNMIPCVSSECHLGNLIGPMHNLHRKSIESTTHNMFGRLNLLLRQFSKTDNDAKYYLFKAYCMSLYGCQLWNFESRDVNYFYTGWRKAIRRIYNVPYNTHCALLPFLCQDESIDCQLHSRFVRFFYNSIVSKNVCISLAAKLALYGSMSDVCHSINYISYKYHFDKYNILNNSCSNFISSPTDNQSEITAGAIRDFLAFNVSDSESDILEIIHHLCTM